MNRIFRTTAACLFFLGSALPCVAQDELDIEALRKELQASHTDSPAAKKQNTVAPAAVNDGFLEDDSLIPDAASKQQKEPALVSEEVASSAKAKLKAPKELTEEIAVPFKNEEGDFLKDENRSLKNQVAELKKKVESKNEDLEKVRNRLVIAETQVERLSAIIEQRNAQRLQGIVPVSPQAKQQQAVAAVVPQQARAAQQPETTQGEMLVATVVANKANLRTGPGSENSPLMTLNKGTRLAVETRQGSWYRVIAPNGSRAWIAGDVLNFESQGNTRVGAYVAPKRQNF